MGGDLGRSDSNVVLTFFWLGVNVRYAHCSHE